MPDYFLATGILSGTIKEIKRRNYKLERGNSIFDVLLKFTTDVREGELRLKINLRSNKNGQLDSKLSAFASSEEPESFLIQGVVGKIKSKDGTLELKIYPQRTNFPAFSVVCIASLDDLELAAQHHSVRVRGTITPSAKLRVSSIEPISLEIPAHHLTPAPTPPT
jgi:hypothetical protein